MWSPLVELVFCLTVYFRTFCNYMLIGGLCWYSYLVIILHDYIHTLYTVMGVEVNVCVEGEHHALIVCAVVLNTQTFASVYVVCRTSAQDYKGAGLTLCI